MIVTVRFSIDGREVSEVTSEQTNEASAMAWVKYAERLLILVRDRDVTKSKMVDFD